MNLIQRGWRSIVKQRGKSVLLFALVLILGIITAGAISVHLAINSTTRGLRHQIPNAMTIGEEVDLVNEYFDNDWGSYERANRKRLTPEIATAIGELPHVQHFDYMESTLLSSFELRGYWGWEDELLSDLTAQRFDLQGTNRQDLIQIEIGTMNLMAGRGFSEEELTTVKNISPVIISEQLARENNLFLGSIFKLYNLIFMSEDDQFNFMDGIGVDDIEFTQVSMEFEVVGLFDIPITSETQIMGQLFRADNDANLRSTALNTLHVPNWVIRDISERTEKEISYILEEQGVQIEPDIFLFKTPFIQTLYIVDHDDMDAFRAAAEPLLPTQFYRILDFSYRIEHLNGAMATLQNIADWILYGSIGATLVIVSLLLTLTLKDRITEMGIYMALGERKWKIYLQVLFESLSVSFIAITFALFVGNVISQNLSQTMIANELNEQWEARDGLAGWAGGSLVFARLAIPNPSMSPDEMMELFDTSLTVETMAVFYLVGLGTVAISTLIPLAWVLSRNPRNILLDDFTPSQSSEFKPKKLIVFSGVALGVSVLSWFIVTSDFEFAESVFEDVPQIEEEALSSAQQDTLSRIENRMESGFFSWEEAVAWAVEENLTIGLRESGARLDEDLLDLINRYGLVGEFNSAEIGIGSVRDDDEFVLWPHFENLGYNQLMAEVFSLNGKELVSWLTSGGRERLESAFGQVDIAPELERGEVLYFDRFKLEGDGRIKIGELVVPTASVDDEDFVLLYGPFPHETLIWVVGEDLPAGRYRISNAERTAERVRELNWSTGTIYDNFFVVRNGREVLNEALENGRAFIYLEDGDEIQIGGILYFTPVTNRSLSNEVGRGNWRVGIDVAPGYVDIVPATRTGRIFLEREGEIIWEEVVGSGRLYELGFNGVQGIPSVRANLQTGDILHITRLPQVHITPLTLE